LLQVSFDQARPAPLPGASRVHVDVEMRRILGQVHGGDSRRMTAASASSAYRQVRRPPVATAQEPQAQPRQDPLSPGSERAAPIGAADQEPTTSSSTTATQACSGS